MNGGKNPKRSKPGWGTPAARIAASNGRRRMPSIPRSPSHVIVGLMAICA